MKLYKYETLESLNKALTEFNEIGTNIAKVKLLTESKYVYDKTTQKDRICLKTVYFILINKSNNYQSKK